MSDISKGMPLFNGRGGYPSKEEVDAKAKEAALKLTDEEFVFIKEYIYASINDNPDEGDVVWYADPSIKTMLKARIDQCIRTEDYQKVESVVISIDNHPTSLLSRLTVPWAGRYFKEGACSATQTSPWSITEGKKAVAAVIQERWK